MKILDRRKVLVCVGAGGVGKTSIAAALALAGAMSGRRSLVVTIDPARRLASALGLDSLADAPTPVAGAPGLEAMMLDQKRAWDRVVTRHAPTPEARDRILGNRFYRHASAAFAGAHEYLALEELASLVEQGRHDLVVVDTPPAVHAFEFLDAPARLAGLLDKRLIRWAAGTARPLGGTARFLASAMAPAAGGSALGDVAELVSAMGSMFETLTRRARAVRDLLRDRGTGIVVVASPDTAGVAAATAAQRRLRDVHLPAAALVVNRAHPRFPEDRDVDAAELAAAGVTGPVEWIAANARTHRRLARAEAARVAELGASAVIPTLDGDIADLGGLRQLVAQLAA